VSEKRQLPFSHMIGLTLNLGSVKMPIRIWVSNKMTTVWYLTGISVDKKNVLLDRDPGIADYLDSCPDVSGTASLNEVCQTRITMVLLWLMMSRTSGSQGFKGCPDGGNDEHCLVRW
jgi:hypothetical protein